MPKRSSKESSEDINKLASKIVEEATTEENDRKESEKDQPEKESKEKGKNPHAQALGRLGGLKGGKARAAKLTPEQRQEIARKAAKARWKKSD